MIRRFVCPRLHGEAELAAERERHIERRHPGLLPAHRDRLAEVLADPDVVQRGDRTAGEHLTAYMARRLRRGGIEWRRS